MDSDVDQPSANPSNSEELDLIRRVSRGNWGAFETLFDRYQRRVFTLALRILGQREDAEDVTQQTFLSVIEHAEQFQERASVSTWLLRIAVNHALKKLRKRRGLPTVPLEIPDEAGNGTPLPHPEFIAEWRELPEAIAERAEVRQLIEEALAELDDKYRLVFLLRDVEGLSTRETGDVLGLSESAVKVRLLRARLMLRERLTRVLGDGAKRIFPSHDHE